MLASAFAFDFSSEIFRLVKWKTLSERVFGSRFCEFSPSSFPSTFVNGNRMARSMPTGKKRSKKGIFDILGLPREISAQEFTKCQNDLPSATTWLIVKAMKTPSSSSVTCTANAGCDVPSWFLTPLSGKKE